MDRGAALALPCLQMKGDNSRMLIKRKYKCILFIICAVVLAVSLFAIGCRALAYRAEKESIRKAIEAASGTEQVMEDNNEIQKIPPATTSIPASPDMEFLLALDIEKLQEVNPDVIGWILIPGSEISFPLLQAEDNTYYLKHSWDKKENSCGSIFYDYRSSPEDWNAVIHGHNMRNGSMFAALHEYKKDEFCKENNQLLILCKGEVRKYTFVAAFEAGLDGVPYMFGDVSNKDMSKFVDEISPKAGREISRNGSFITLSTCTGLGHKTRWVVVFHEEMQGPKAEIQFLSKEEKIPIVPQV